MHQKKLLSTVCLGLMIVFAGYAQNCRATLFLKKGNTLEYTAYNKKGKATSKATHETVSLNEVPGKSIATIKVVSEDMKGKDSFTSEYKVTCENGLFKIDMARFFDMAKLQEYDEDDFIVEIDGNVLEFPKGAVAGDELNDGSITVRVAKTGFTVITMIMDVKNRKFTLTNQLQRQLALFHAKK